MAISKYIPKDKPPVSESELERAINKGGSTLKATHASDTYRIQVRIPQDILSKIDHAVKENRYEGYNFHDMHGS